MSDTQLYLAIGVPSILALANFTATLVLFGSLRDDIRELRGDMKLLTGKVYEMMEKR